MSSDPEKEHEFLQLRGILLERIALLVCILFVLITDNVDNCNPLDTFTPLLVSLMLETIRLVNP
jgi:hypothetical protein